MKKLKDRIDGCLFGLAVGDALGAPVEFMDIGQIKSTYGKKGIQDLEEWGGFPAGSYTDDTQMALATARGLVRALEIEKKQVGDIVDPDPYVYEEYTKWLKTQDNPRERRAPGNTCLSALQSGQMGTIEAPLNNSKGCGGVMRTAPVGLMLTGEDAFKKGADFAAMTHGHPSGYLPAGFLSSMIHWIIKERDILLAFNLSFATVKQYPGHEETETVVQKALDFLLSDEPDKPAAEIIPQIGEGWVGEEALAISVYCAMRFHNSFKAGVLAAGNHSGDSDSTGSITGAILGALLGVEAIPREWREKVENASYIQKLAEDILQLHQ
jgi:ADP-ribosylglycohydrolase